MIRTCIGLCGAGALAFAGHAQTVTAPDGTATSTMAVTGSVPSMCILGDPQLDAGLAATNVSSLAGRVLQIDQLIDPATLSTRATRAAVALDAMCNYPYAVTVRSDNNGLWREMPMAPTPNGFGNAVPYYADVSWDTNDVRLNADATARSPRLAGFSSTAETAAPLVIDFHILPGSTNAVTQAPLLAGIYRDTITITVAPQ